MERWKKWRISLKKRHKEGDMIAIDKQWGSSSLGVSLFLVLHPAWSKPIPRWTGSPVHHWTGHLAAAGFCSREDLAKIKRWSWFFTEWLGLPRVQDWGSIWFGLYVCLCLDLNLFILQVIAHPTRSPTCRELSVLSCLMGICLGEVYISLSALQFSRCSWEAVLAL